MIRIIHLSDFHLEKEEPSLEKANIIQALVNDLKNQTTTNSILVFTGDLIDKGGANFSNQEQAFNSFEKEFIEVITDNIPILKGRFFITPGNHDVFRGKIDIYSEAGLKGTLNNSSSVSTFIKDNRLSSRHFDRLQNYKDWEQNFYKKSSYVSLSNFDNTFSVEIDKYKVGISCLNSSWLCKDDNDKESLILGKEQIESSLSQIKDCQIKIALLHHPLEFITEFDREDCKAVLFKYYNILFTGHVHELGSSYTQDLYGDIFISIANSTIADSPKERKFANGYTIIDLYPNEKIIAHYRKYIEQHNVFVSNTDIGSDIGSKEFQILKDASLEQFRRNKTLIEGLESRYVDKLNEDIIMATSQTNANCSIDALFVEPTILNYPQRSLDEAETIQYNLESILNSPSNFLIYGLKESGKTILLDKLFLESIKKFNQFDRIPVLLKFSEIKKGNLLKILREYLSISSNEIHDFLSENKLIIFIDDMLFNGKGIAQHEILGAFLSVYENVKVVACSDQILENIIPTDYLEYNKIYKFDIAFIQNFNSSEIKQLVSKWFAGREIDMQENMQRLIKSFVEFGLPKTPLSVTLFLWIFERQEKRPINNSVLVEMFVENLLEKTKIENIYAETFDFKNKQRLLSFIAKFMRDSGDPDLSYSVDYVDLLNYVRDYLKIRFTGQPQKVLDDFIKRGVLTFEDENLVRFKAAFFFHYFLALHFDFDAGFKKHVFSDDNYLNYTEEINYYTGLRRDDIEILKFTQEKLDKVFGVFNLDIQKNFEKVDDVLEPKGTGPSLTYEIGDVKQEDKLNEEELDKIYDDTLTSIPVQREIPKKDISNNKKGIDSVLKLAANVLKNSEDIDDFNSKQAAYDKIILSSISFLMQYRDALIRYFVKYKKKPEVLPKNIDFHLFIQVMPLFHQIVIYEWMGSQKLRPVILERINNDKQTLNISEFEKALSIFIYSDIKGANYPEIVRDFVKSTSFTYLKDLSFLKVLSYFHLRNNSKELDEMYLKTLSEIREDLGRLQKNRKDQFKKQLMEQKKKER